MSAARAVRRDAASRRRALRLGYLNGMLWSIGNGLTTGTLVTYLAIDLGARGLGLSLLLAAPTWIGLLRILTPLLIERFGTAPRATLVFSLVSYLLVWGLPAAGAMESAPQSPRLALLIGLVSVHQLLEYMGQVALWAWFADLVPPRIRGRYFGRRQVLQLAVLIPTLLASGQFSDWWRQWHQPSQGLLWGYAIPNAVGAVMLLASLVPLTFMPETELNALRRAWGTLVAPLADFRFRRLLLYGCWLSFFNGVTQAPQNIFPKEVLKLGVRPLAAMRIAMQLGQMAISGWVGRFSDRHGNRPVLVVSQFSLALAPAFF